MRLFPFSFMLTSKVKDLHQQNAHLKQELDIVSKVLSHLAKQSDAEARKGLAVMSPSALSKELLTFADYLHGISLADQQRAWKNDGLLSVNRIVNEHHAGVDSLFDSLLKFLVKYTTANQGAIFLADKERTSLSLKACYAYEKKKWMGREFGVGEGLVGQCFLEAEKIILKKVPSEYVKITSGLGQAVPTYVILLPMLSAKLPVGVIELAFFHELAEYEVSFLQAVSEILGNAAVNMRSSDETRELLEQSQKSSALLREQEEELKQNIEEMTSIQEDLARKNSELEAAKSEIENILKREKEMIQAQLITQQAIHDKIVERLKQKITSLQNEVHLRKELSLVTKNGIKLTQQ